MALALRESRQAGLFRVERLGSWKEAKGEFSPGRGSGSWGHPGCATKPGDPRTAFFRAASPGRRAAEPRPGHTATSPGVWCHVPAPGPQRESKTLLNYGLMVHFQPIGCPEQEFQLHLAFRAPQGPFAAALTERWSDLSKLLSLFRLQMRARSARGSR